MPILFDSRDALLGGEGEVLPGQEFGAMRDWLGHTGEDFEIGEPIDFVWSGSDHVARTDLPGPYDIQNQIYYTSGTDSLQVVLAVAASNPEPIIEIAAWVKLEDVPTPGATFDLSFFKLEDTVSNWYIQIVFRARSDNTIALVGQYSDGATVWEYEHPDKMDRTEWLFFSVLFDHTNSLADRIYIDPGNDNVLSSNPGPSIASSDYDVADFLGGAGQAPGDIKGVRFADILLLRESPTTGGPDTDVIFDVPGADSYIVPIGVTEITCTMWAGGGGGGGGGSSGDGGNASGSGYTKAVQTVVPAETLDLFVAGGGDGGAGGTLSGSGGGGGGHSFMKRGATPLQFSGSGAGGGGGDNSSPTDGGDGGEGGANIGEDGGPSSTALPGEGGTQVAGGDGGVGGNTGEDGASEDGGDGAAGDSGIGGTFNGGAGNGGDGGIQSSSTPGFAGGGGGAAGFFGGGGGGSSFPSDAGGGGGGGASNYIDAGATTLNNEQAFGFAAAGWTDPLWVSPTGDGGSGGFPQGTGFDGGDGRVVISFSPSSASWRATVRSFTMQVQFDYYQITLIKAVRLYRTSEHDLGGGLGDRFIHDISQFLMVGTAPTGTLDRSVGAGPLDTTNSYEYTNGCTATTDNDKRTLFFAPFTEWDLTWFCFFRQPVSVVNDVGWFLRFENDFGEYIQLERNSTVLTRTVQLATGGPITDVNAGTPLFDGSWHRLVMTASDTVAGNWDVAVDGTRYFPDVTPQPLSSPIKRVMWGNVDVNLAVMGWANYYDPDIYTSFTSQNTEAAVRGYIEARTDDPSTGTASSEYYSGYYPMQNTITGVS